MLSGRSARGSPSRHSALHGCALRAGLPTSRALCRLPGDSDRHLAPHRQRNDRAPKTHPTHSCAALRCSAPPRAAPRVSWTARPGRTFTHPRCQTATSLPGMPTEPSPQAPQVEAPSAVAGRPPRVDPGREKRRRGPLGVHLPSCRHKSGTTPLRADSQASRQVVPSWSPRPTSRPPRRPRRCRSTAARTAPRGLDAGRGGALVSARCRGVSYLAGAGRGRGIAWHRSRQVYRRPRRRPTSSPRRISVGMRIYCACAVAGPSAAGRGGLALTLGRALFGASWASTAPRCDARRVRSDRCRRLTGARRVRGRHLVNTRRIWESE